MRLTARLYFEHLLDQDQHLDWFLSSLEMASLDRLPIWLMVLGVYWGSIVPFRRRGRKLMEILLEKLRHVCDFHFRYAVFFHQLMELSRSLKQGRKYFWNQCLIDCRILSGSWSMSKAPPRLFLDHGTNTETSCPPAWQLIPETRPYFRLWPIVILTCNVARVQAMSLNAPLYAK